ncbi:MAG: hypothetical protein AAGG09_04250 [Pseudomonadota bacterium]
MNEDPKKKIEQAMSDLDMRLGGLLGALGSSLTEAIEKLDAQDSAELHRSHEIDTARGPLRAEAGVRIRFAGESVSGRSGSAGVSASPAGGGVQPRRPAPAEPRARPAATGAAEAGHERPAADGPEAAARAVHLDHFTDRGRWIACGDFPGVGLPDVDLRIEDRGGVRTLRVRTTGARTYRAEIELPDEADTSSMGTVLRNGVLEIAMDLGSQGAQGE